MSPHSQSAGRGVGGARADVTPPAHLEAEAFLQEWGQLVCLRLYTCVSQRTKCESPATRPSAHTCHTQHQAFHPPVLGTCNHRQNPLASGTFVLTS